MVVVVAAAAAAAAMRRWTLNAFSDDARTAVAAASESLRFVAPVREAAATVVAPLPRPLLALHARVESDWREHCRELEQQLSGALKVCPASVEAVAAAAVEVAGTRTTDG